jgi:hypothetical protein
LAKIGLFWPFWPPTALTLFLCALARGNIEIPPKTGSKNDIPETKYFGVAAYEGKNGHFLPFFGHF